MRSKGNDDYLKVRFPGGDSGKIAGGARVFAILFVLAGATFVFGPMIYIGIKTLG